VLRFFLSTGNVQASRHNVYRASSLNEILFHGNCEQPMSGIDVVSAQSQTRGHLLDAPASVGESRLSAITGKAVVASPATSTSGIGFSRSSADKLTDHRARATLSLDEFNVADNRIFFEDNTTFCANRSTRSTL
jgi:hypothetical protein